MNKHVYDKNSKNYPEIIYNILDVKEQLKMYNIYV